MSGSGNPPVATDEGAAPGRARLPLATKLFVGVLLLIPLVALALVPTYSSETPKLWGFPFFYWYQLLWVILTPIFTWTAYVLIVRARKGVGR